MVAIFLSKQLSSVHSIPQSNMTVSGIDFGDQKLIYLDNNASTPIAPSVLAVMDKYKAIFGNPHSGHFLGAISRSALDQARKQVLDVFGLSADAWTCIFTSGASECNNLAIKGVVMHALRTKPAETVHVCTSAVEHASIDKCVDYLGDLFGKARVTSARFPVDIHGVVNIEAVEEELRSHGNTLIVSCIQTVAETGAVQPVAEIANVAKRLSENLIFHCDASQSVGKLSFDHLNSLAQDVDLITVAGHKFGAPKGIGALLVRNTVMSRIDPLIHGAGQEFGIRGGTENVLFAIALGAACDLAKGKRQSTELKDLLWEIISDEFKLSGKRVDFRLNSTAPICSPLTINFSVAGTSGPCIVSAVGNAKVGTINVCFSAGSACHSRGAPSPSKVLAAMGIDEKYSTSGLRLSLGPATTEAQVRLAGPIIAKAIIDVL